MLSAGPYLYPQLQDMLIQFHKHKIGMSADISKMFLRSSLLQPHERVLHRFIMRNEGGLLVNSCMKRLTFGMKSFLFIATQVVRHLTASNHLTHPEAATAIAGEMTCCAVPLRLLKKPMPSDENVQVTPEGRDEVVKEAYELSKPQAADPRRHAGIPGLGAFCQWFSS